MRPPPRRPIGTSAEAQFAQWVYDMILSLQPRDAPGVLTDRTTRGVFRRSADSAKLPVPVQTSE